MSEKVDQPALLAVLGAVEKSARMSPCGLYRYTLSRHWGPGEALMFVMLNPSTADADLDDPTIRRCVGFAKREGFSALTVVNLYAYRATDPKALLTCGDPVGPDNDQILSLYLLRPWTYTQPVVCAWGANAKPDRVKAFMEKHDEGNLFCLGTTKSGAPKHPLYIPANQPLLPFGSTATKGSER